MRQQGFVNNRLKRLPSDKAGAIQNDLAEIRKVRRQLKQVARDAVRKVNAMGRKLRALRRG